MMGVSLQPWQWLQYQLSFAEDADPFTRSFRCLYLSQLDPLDFRRPIQNSQKSVPYHGASTTSSA